MINNIKDQQKKRRPLLINYLLKGLSFIGKAFLSFFLNEYYDYYHLEIGFKNGLLSLRCIHHSDYAHEKELELRNLRKKLSSEKFVREAFKKCKKCNFIIFNCGDEKRFVQFWLGDGKIMANWPLAKGNKLNKYKFAMLGVLNEMGITRNFRSDDKNPYEFKFKYSLIKDHYFDSYSINFDKDASKAAVFTKRIFTEVFKQDFDKLKFEMG